MWQQSWYFERESAPLGFILRHQGKWTFISGTVQMWSFPALMWYRFTQVEVHCKPVAVPVKATCIGTTIVLFLVQTPYVTMTMWRVQNILLVWQGAHLTRKMYWFAAHIGLISQMRDCHGHILTTLLYATGSRVIELLFSLLSQIDLVGRSKGLLCWPSVWHTYLTLLYKYIHSVHPFLSFRGEPEVNENISQINELFMYRLLIFSFTGFKEVIYTRFIELTFLYIFNLAYIHTFH